MERGGRDGQRGAGGGYEAVDVKVNGDVATMTWPAANGNPSPILLRKVKGVWKVSIPDIIAWGMKQGGATEAQARELEAQVLEISSDRVRRLVSGLTWLSRDVAAGKYASAEEARAAAATIMSGKKK
jgi:hypothetical protein